MSNSSTTTRCFVVGILMLVLSMAPDDWATVADLRAIVAIPVVLIVPGLALYRALPLEHRSSVADVLMHSIALSVIAVIAVGLLLTLTPFGLQGEGFLFCLGIIVVISTIVRMFQSEIPNDADPVASGSQAPSIMHAIVLGVAAVMLLSAVRVAWSGARVEQEAGAVALWLYVDESASIGSETWIVAGLRQPDGRGSQSYRVELRHGDEIVLHWDSLQLAGGETWQQRLTVGEFVDTWVQPLDLYLYRLSDSDSDVPYRWVRLHRSRDARG